MNPELKEAVVHGSKEYPFAIYDLQHLKSSFHVAMHWHEEIEIVYVYEGPLYLTISDASFVGQSGDVFIVNSKEIHEMYAPNKYVRYGTLLFSLNYLLFGDGDFITHEYLQPLINGVTSFKHQITEPLLCEKIFEIIAELLRLNKQKVPAYRFGTKALLLQIISLFFQYDLEQNNTSLQKNTTLNREILTYISEHYSTNLTLGEIANKFHMSYKYFSRYFKNTFHSTLSEYIMKLRMERAELLLSTTELAITEISMQTGFNNISFFIRCFKKTYGCSPLQYRQQHKKPSN